LPGPSVVWDERDALAIKALEMVQTIKVCRYIWIDNEEYHLNIICSWAHHRIAFLKMKFEDA
jgi:hypothetical protein